MNSNLIQGIGLGLAISYMDINVLETNYVVKFDTSLVKNKKNLSYLYNYHKNGTYLLNKNLIDVCLTKMNYCDKRK